MTVPNHTLRPIARSAENGGYGRYPRVGTCAKRDGGRFGTAVMLPRTPSDLVVA
ncbi:hypothetical protein [Halegenticoccus soli]|uniref:hypothetical protein n=1 Tax=Halegenticoccus soli TaxID=1985678 RepID=UPI0013046A5F|nr:hypothetical protein [Halegenticoccus soli]